MMSLTISYFKNYCRIIHGSMSLNATKHSQPGVNKYFGDIENNNNIGYHLHHVINVDIFHTWGIMARFLLRSCSPSLAISTPSIMMTPLAASTMRKSANVMELLPAPVRPTIPTWWTWKCIIRLGYPQVLLDAKTGTIKIYDWKW